MILVDIYTPAFDKNYDFQIEEKAYISDVIYEVSEMISQKEHCKMNGNPNELDLCSLDHHGILDVEKTLEECGVQTGSKLILV